MEEGHCTSSDDGASQGVADGVKHDSDDIDPDDNSDTMMEQDAYQDESDEDEEDSDKDAIADGEDEQVSPAGTNSAAATAAAKAAAPVPAEDVDGSEDGAVVLSPYFDDVVSGRGKGPNEHFGNQSYRRLIRSNCAAYKQLVTQREKGVFVNEVVARVKATGRFLKLIGENEYIEMDDEEARRKVGQSLRYQMMKLSKEKDGKGK